jgi:uncharacterized Zn finger protein
MKLSRRTELADVITETLLLEEAGERSFARGAAYFESGAVTDLVVSGETINARVEGGQEYAVRLWPEDGELGYSCTCPVGEDGAFCKHAVAAGLAWIADRTEARGALQGRSGCALARQQETPPARRGEDDLTAIREWLGKAPREQLAELLLEQALGDPALRSRLDARAVRAAGRRSTDFKALREAVNKALAVGSYVDYHGMHKLVERASSAVELISGLIEDGHSQTAVELADYALRRGIAAYQHVDDSDGDYGELLGQIAELHLTACRLSPPEPAALGQQLFELTMLDDWDLLAFEDYVPLLGDIGLQAFRALAEREWTKIPTRKPGDDDAHDYVSGFKITSVMEALARQAGDVDALVAIMSRNLSYPYHFLQIAEVLAKAGRRDDALAWAERGHKTFPDRPDSRLTEFLAAEYGHRGRHDEAIALAWEQLQQRPALDSYQHLKQCCKRPGNWDEWRTKALAWIREKLHEKTQANPLSRRDDSREGGGRTKSGTGVERARVRDGFHRNMYPWLPNDRSLLVEIFL